MTAVKHVQITFDCQAPGQVAGFWKAALQAEATRLEALGARRLRFWPADDENESCVVMQDIEGNEFCRERQ